MRLLMISMFCMVQVCLHAQKTSPLAKFGSITLNDLRKGYDSMTSRAGAIVLADIAHAAIEGNSKGWFSISFVHHRIVHIINRQGYGQADVEFPLYANSGNEEKLESIKAATYNISGDKIETTKIERSSIYTVPNDRHQVVVRFSFPKVKEGSIIEFEYKMTSDYIGSLDPWYFQENIPVAWSEYNFSVPQFFTYSFLQHGYVPVYISDQQNHQSNFIVADSRGTGATRSGSFPSGVTNYRWVLRDVPVFKEEEHASSIKNHIASIEFQLVSSNHPLEYHDYRSTWPMLTAELLRDENFGAFLEKNNGWIGDEIKPLLTAKTSNEERARKIFAYVRDNFASNGSASLYATQSMRSVMKTKTGSVAEINLLLTAMLRYAGLNAAPVLLSTVDHGYVLDNYPAITNFNYVVVRLVIDQTEYFLDASQAFNGFGKLPAGCYNGQARVVNEEATRIMLAADSLGETTLTNVIISNDKEGKWIGAVRQTPGYYASTEMRRELKEKGIKSFFDEAGKDFGLPVTIHEPFIDAINNYDAPLVIRYNLEFMLPNEKSIYFNPLPNVTFKTNPFSSGDRLYPIELPYTIDESYEATIEVPAGYRVASLPEQMIARMDSASSGYFEYRISQSGNFISLRTSLKISRTFFLPEEHKPLHDFFKMVVDKQNEKIIFTRKEM